MAANVEKMTRRLGTEESWHGEENQTDIIANKDLNEWAHNAGLDSLVHKQVLYVKSVQDDQDVFTPVTDQIALQRESDGRILGYASPKYEVVQPMDLLEFLDSYIKLDERFAWETAGSLDGGRKMFAQATFAEDQTVLGEVHKAKLLASTSFDGSLATILAATMQRVVCQNTLRMALNSKETVQLKFRHSNEWNENMITKAKADLEHVMKGFDHYKAMAEALAAVRLSDDQVKKFLSGLMHKPKLVEQENAAGETVKVWSAPGTRTKNQIDRLIESYNETLNEGTEKNTGWATLNAITRYADHSMGVRMTSGRESEGVTKEQVLLESRLFGSGDKFKQSGITDLLKFCDVDVRELVAA